MNKRKIEQAPSDTALFTALRRTLANKKYKTEKLGPDYLAEVFLPAHYRFFLKFKRVRENTWNKLAGFMPGLTEYVIARTALFDGFFITALKDKTPQIVLLGAGYDSRAYRFANLNSGSRIYELDAAPTQNRKIKCLKSAHVRIPAEVHFVPIDFINESLGGTLEKAGYKNTERTLFIWEGVSYYLDLDSAKTTLDFVSRSSHRDSVIAFDYMVLTNEENIHKYYGASELMKSMKEHHANEQLMFSIKDGEARSFLEENGLRMLEHLDSEAIEQKFLMDDNGSLIGHMAGNLRFTCASPMKDDFSK